MRVSQLFNTLLFTQQEEEQTRTRSESKSIIQHSVLHSTTMASFEDTDNILEALAPRIQETKELAQHYSNNDNDWEKLWEKVNIIASKRNMSDENKVCVRGQTTFNQSPLEVFKILQNVTDIDEVMKQHDVLMRLSPLVAIEHIYVNTPWPVTPRDGLSISFIDVDNDGTVYLLAFGYENDVICPPIKGMIRSELTITGFILKPNEQGGTNATYILQVFIIY